MPQDHEDIDRQYGYAHALRAELAQAAADAKAGLRGAPEDQLPPATTTRALCAFLQRRGTDLTEPLAPEELCTSCCRRRNHHPRLSICRRCAREQRLPCLTSLHDALWVYAGFERTRGISCPLCDRLLEPPGQRDLPLATDPFDPRAEIEARFDARSGAAVMLYVEHVLMLELPATAQACARGFDVGDGRTLLLGGTTELFALAVSFETLVNDIEAEHVQPEVVVAADAAASFVTDGRRAIRALIDVHHRQRQEAG